MGNKTGGKKPTRRWRYAREVFEKCQEWEGCLLNVFYSCYSSLMHYPRRPFYLPRGNSLCGLCVSCQLVCHWWPAYRSVRLLLCRPTFQRNRWITSDLPATVTRQQLKKKQHSSIQLEAFYSNSRSRKSGNSSSTSDDWSSLMRRHETSTWDRGRHCIPSRRRPTYSINVASNTNRMLNYIQKREAVFLFGYRYLLFIY